MTSDLDTTTDDLYNTIKALWLDAQGAGGEDFGDGSFGQRVTSVADTEIATASELDLGAVREFLDNADGVKLIVGRDGDARSVKGVL